MHAGIEDPEDCSGHPIAKVVTKAQRLMMTLETPPGGILFMACVTPV
jgi:hypothetical protein